MSLLLHTFIKDLGMSLILYLKEPISDVISSKPAENNCSYLEYDGTLSKSVPILEIQ
jgi:hypothetical protein